MLVCCSTTTRKSCHSKTNGNKSDWFIVTDISFVKSPFQFRGSVSSKMSKAGHEFCDCNFYPHPSNTSGSTATFVFPRAAHASEHRLPCMSVSFNGRCPSELNSGAQSGQEWESTWAASNIWRRSLFIGDDTLACAAPPPPELLPGPYALTLNLI